MKEKEQIELAQEIIANAQDYIELAKVQRKLKVENVDQQIDNVTEFIKNNVKELWYGRKEKLNTKTTRSENAFEN